MAKFHSFQPLLCCTYSFYLDQGKLMESEYRSWGGKIERQEAERMAEQLSFPRSRSWRRPMPSWSDIVTSIEGRREWKRLLCTVAREAQD